MQWNEKFKMKITMFFFVPSLNRSAAFWVKYSQNNSSGFTLFSFHIFFYIGFLLAFSHVRHCGVLVSLVVVIFHILWKSHTSYKVQSKIDIHVRINFIFKQMQKIWTICRLSSVMKFFESLWISFIKIIIFSDCVILILLQWFKFAWNWFESILQQTSQRKTHATKICTTSFYHKS